MSDDKIIKGWFREGPEAKTAFITAGAGRAINDSDAGFDEGCMAPDGTEPQAVGKKNPTAREIGFDRGLEFGRYLTEYADKSRHPSAQVRGRK